MENEYYYTEGLCYLENHVEEITDRTQESIDTALSKNGAVGVAGGYYEEGLPLEFISNFMIISLGYSNVAELSRAADGKLINLIWPEDRGLFQLDVFRQVDKPRKYRIITKTGEAIWVREVKTESMDTKGINIWTISLRNIDAEYKRELKLQKQSADLKDTVNALGILYHKVLKINLTEDSFEEINLEQEKDVIQCKNPIHISQWVREFAEAGNILEEDKKIYLDFCNIEWLKQQFKEGAKNLSCHYRRLIDGEFHWVKMEVVPSAEYTHDSQFVIFYIIDVEEDIRKQNEVVIAMQEAAAATTTLKRQIEITKSLGSFYFAIYSLDIAENQYTEIVTREYFSYDVPQTGKADELLKKVCELYVTSEYQNEMKEFFRLDTLCERIGDGQIISHVYKSTHGWCRASFIVEHREEDGRIIYITYTSQSIDNEIMAELETQNKLRIAVEEAERANAAKSDFLSRMSHDIRTPINGVMGMLEIIKKNRDDKARVDDCIQKISVSAKYLLALLSDVLDMNKLESGSIELVEEPFDILELMDYCYQIEHGQAAKNDIELTMELPKESVHQYLLGSPLHIRHILLNIISNGIKYNKSNGKVHIKMEELSATEDTVVFQFIIEDTGIGMSEEFLEHIFETFTQENDSARTTFQGTGLGMAIVKKLIDKMDGNIVVESRKDVGSKFTFQLPLHINPKLQVQAGQLEDGKEPDISQMKILLVEDNEMNMEIAQFLFGDMGAIITPAENGQIAVDIFRESKPGDFDLILMDIMMPVMDGLKATQTIRKLDRPDAGKIPIIAMSANAFAEDVKKCKEAGMNAHIAKPIDLEKALITIAKYKKKEQPLDI